VRCWGWDFIPIQTRRISCGYHVPTKNGKLKNGARYAPYGTFFSFVPHTPCQQAYHALILFLYAGISPIRRSNGVIVRPCAKNRECDQDEGDDKDCFARRGYCSCFLYAHSINAMPASTIGKLNHCPMLTPKVIRPKIPSSGLRVNSARKRKLP